MRSRDFPLALAFSRYEETEKTATQATFSQTLTFKEAFEAPSQQNKEVKWTELDGTFCKQFKLLLDRFSSFFRKTYKIGRENDP